MAIASLSVTLEGKARQTNNDNNNKTWETDDDELVGIINIWVAEEEIVRDPVDSNALNNSVNLMAAFGPLAFLTRVHYAILDLRACINRQ
jgi:hypothetical protein